MKTYICRTVVVFVGFAIGFALSSLAWRAEAAPYRSYWHLGEIADLAVNKLDAKKFDIHLEKIHGFEIPTECWISIKLDRAAMEKLKSFAEEQLERIEAEDEEGGPLGG